MHGVYNFLKPPGLTSHDVVSYARRVLGTKRIGHTGTLDPAASGVLPLCVGHATRLVEYLQSERKTYIAEIGFGSETDTLDALGQTIAHGDFSHLNEEKVRAILEQFTGKIAQIPPMYSALKRDGQSLHEIARAGGSVEIETRPVTIYDLQLTRFERAASTCSAWIRVECGSGTYIRSLIRDIGRALECPATMNFLVRTQSGRFSINDAILPQHLADAAPFSLHTTLQWCATREIVSTAAAQRLSHGQKATIEAGNLTTENQNERVLVRNEAMTIFALATPDEIGASAREGGRFRVEKLFFNEEANVEQTRGLLA